MRRPHVPNPSTKTRFRMAYAFLGVIAVVWIGLAVLLAITPSNGAGSSNGRTSGSGPGDGGSTPSPAATPQLSGFALELQDWADQSQAHFGGPKARIVDCIQGGPGDFFCAFVVKGECHAAHVVITNGNIVPQEAGRIGISVADCTAANSLHWIGKQNG